VAGVKLPSFSSRLLRWWDAHGRKDLPWQHPRTAYRVWISEIMLQQTQVATVIPYFERWMKNFPNIYVLAEASPDDVLSHWSGLGYYARARNLHKAAVLCMEQHGGQLPQGAENLAALPGIGRSTANAIVSQSTGQPAPVLDGNVRRVLARHAATQGWTGKSSVQKQLWHEAGSRLPETRGADYTQAIMDLGALLCLRSNPRCGQCPVKSDCRALALGRVKDFPSRKPMTRISDRTLHMLILQDSKSRVLLEKRAPAGIWGGLWCLPEGESVAAVGAALGVSLSVTTALTPVEHRLSHVRMDIHPALATALDAGQVKCTPHLGWFDRAQQKKLGLPKPVTDLLMRLNNGEFV
jgi:A/G-specific adenine glycosylase